MENAECRKCGVRKMQSVEKFISGLVSPGEKFTLKRVVSGFVQYTISIGRLKYSTRRMLAYSRCEKKSIAHGKLDLVQLFRINGISGTKGTKCIT